MNSREIRVALEERVNSVLNKESSEADPSIRAIHVAALDYAARYLRSIMADKAASLLELRAMDLQFDGLEIEDTEQRGDRTMVGLGVRPVPAGYHSFA